MKIRLNLTNCVSLRRQLVLMQLQSSLPVIAVSLIIHFSFEKFIIHEFLIRVQNQIALLETEKNICSLLLDPALPHNCAI